jgi:hypothetical protein
MSIAVEHERFILTANRLRGSISLSVERRSKLRLALSGGNS